MYSAQLQAQAELERRRRQAIPKPPLPPLHEFAARTKIEVQHGDESAIVPFELWPEQIRVLDLMAYERLLVILKARQLGISWLFCLYLLDLCVKNNGKTVLLFSQGQLEANELIRRIILMYREHEDVDQLPVITIENTTEVAWANGSRVKSLAATKRGGRSFTASVVVLDEFAFMQFGSEVFAAAKPTINDGGKLFIVSSADGSGTAYHRFWESARSGVNGFKPVFLSWRANPTRHEGWRQERLAEVFDDEASVKREYPETPDEAFTNAAGLIYDTWSEFNISKDADYLPGGGPVYWAVDDGYTGQRDPVTGLYTGDSHPRTFLLIQERADGRFCVFAEHHAIHKLSDQHVDEVLALPYPEPDWAAVDKAAAELKGRIQGKGIYTRNSASDVEESIKVLRRMLAPDTNGWRRIQVHPRCQLLISEMSHYRRDQNGRIIKQYDHALDGLRYFTWQYRNG